MIIFATLKSFMKLSIVIVNYNVEHFLEQCLFSVRKAIANMEAEVFVVDNNSVDGSLKMLSEKFPEVKVIANKNNVGFSRANNQAIRVSTGEYVLLLNPDTVVEDDTFTKTVEFMDSHPDAGGLGVKMVDGKGRFLPESKRGLPTPATAFYKMFGLTKLFPHSKRFARYYLGHLNNDEINEVEILSGAFMLMRRETLDKSGLLDETFFMYGEDIDLSYRIMLAGYKNYYFPKTRIIHYKGESTKKTSVNYVLIFYKAMEIFVKKHFANDGAKTFSFFINIAIYFKAFLALLSQFFSKAVQPLLDTILGYVGLAAIGFFWGNAMVYDGDGTYPTTLFAIILPIYLLIWLLTSYFTGGYDKPYKIAPAAGGVFAGSLLILVLYALLPEQLRFSRALILLGMIWVAAEMSLTRWIGYLLKRPNFQYGNNAKKRFLIIGSNDETARVGQLLQSTSIKPDFIGLIFPFENQELPDNFLGKLNQVPEIIEIYKINEIIFCSKDMSHQLIIDKMEEWQSSLDYKIAPEDTLSIIGSNSINTRGDLYTIDIKTIGTSYNKRNKRLFDVLSSSFGIIFWIFLIFFIDKPVTFLKNCFKVLFGKYSWIGYCEVKDSDAAKLPKIKKGIFDLSTNMRGKGLSEEEKEQLNLKYARDYSLSKDINFFLKAIRKQ